MQQCFGLLRRFLPSIFVILLLAAPAELLAQSGNHDMVRSGGGYLSIIKLALITVAFLLWVRCADWVNRDSMKLGADTGLIPEIWNPINVVTFVIGFLAAISVPLFIAGYSAFVLTAFLPPMIYWFSRRGKLKSNPAIALKATAKPGDIPTAPPLPQDEGAVMDFVPAGEDDREKQVNLIRARQSEGFPNLKDLLDQCLKKRVDVVLMDYTREQAASRMQIDGAWHTLPLMDRVTGDALLISLKNLAGLNPADRRSKQLGFMRAISPTHKCDLEVISQGTQTGERIQVKFHKKVKERLTINQLGMWPEMGQRLAGHMNTPGITIISALPLGGLTSTWQAALEHSDKITRDCVAIVDHDDIESELENILIYRYDSTKGETPMSQMKQILLKQPDCIVVPNYTDAETLDVLSSEASTEERSVILQARANSAAEALIRVYSNSKKRPQFAAAVTSVTNQRLLRRLCEQCRVEVQVQPKLIQQLGGDPRQQNTIYTQFKMPPPEQRVDERGKPIEIPVCRACNGIGYLGRIAAFELLEVTDAVRQVLNQKPSPAAIEKVAVAEGKLPLIKEAYKLVLLGITSISEVQRALKS